MRPTLTRGDYFIMSYLIERAKKGVQSKINSFIDAQVTAKLKPFLEVGTGPNGEPCSDFVVNDEGDMSIENMMLKPAVVNDVLVKRGSPLRVAMIRCKRVFLDLPWGDLAGGHWTLDVDDLMIVLYPLERESWSEEDVCDHAAGLWHALRTRPALAAPSPPCSCRSAPCTGLHPTCAGTLVR